MNRRERSTAIRTYTDWIDRGAWAVRALITDLITDEFDLHEHSAGCHRLGCSQRDYTVTTLSAWARDSWRLAVRLESLQ